MPDLSFATLWPYVQIVLEPFAGIISTLGVMFVAATALGIFVRILRS